jgi:hypothetical protein
MVEEVLLNVRVEVGNGKEDVVRRKSGDWEIEASGHPVI